VGILTYLEESTPLQIQDNFKRFKREFSKYYDKEWTVDEEINKSLIPKYKRVSILNFSKNTMKQLINREFYEQQQEETTVMEVVKEEKTGLGEGNVRLRPTATNTILITNNKAHICIRQEIPNRNSKSKSTINNSPTNHAASTATISIHTGLRHISRWDHPRVTFNKL
jgi:hypothetical protein